MEKREDRRDRTWRVAERNWKLRLRLVEEIKWMPKSNHFYAKRKANYCRCSKDKRGGGVCKGLKYKRPQGRYTEE